MVDQPNHKSFKVRGHTRQRKSSKPYTRPSEPKNKGLLDKVKDYFSPSWLFGYFTSNEDEPGPSSLEEDVLDQNATVTHEEGSTSSSYAQQQGRVGSLEEEHDDDDDSAFASFEMNNDRILLDDKCDKRHTQGFEEDNKRERVEDRDSSIRLSGSLDDDIEDENERRSLKQPDKPHSVLSYSTEKLKRKPLPSLLNSRPSSSSLLLQRGMPSVHSQGNSRLGSLSARSTLNIPSIKFSTPMTSNSTSFLNTNKPSSSVSRPIMLSTRNSSLRDNNFTRNELSSEDGTARVNTEAINTAAQSLSSASSAPLFSVEKFVTPVQRTFRNKRVGSPSYPGPIMYGGALNISRDVPFKRRRTSSPGSETYHPVSKLRIRGVKEKPIPNSTFGSSGTRTAQRILDALESVSSPLKDVHRIPSPISLASASPLSFMPSKMRTTPPKMKVGPRVSYLQAKLLGEPPVSSLQTSAVAKVSFVEDSVSKQTKPRSPSSSPPGNPLTHRVEEQSFFSGLKDTVLKSSLPTSFAPKSLPTSLSPIENTNKSSGKIRIAPRSTGMHYSSKNNQEGEVVNPLPEIRNAVPLSFNPSNNLFLPMLNSSKNTTNESKSENVYNKQLDVESSTRNKLPTESPKNGFIFSSPEPKSRYFSVKETLEIADDEVTFSFSEPVPIKKNFGSAKEDFRNPLLLGEKTANNLKATWNHSPNQNLKTNSLLTSSPSNVATLGDWNCSSCMTTNKAADQKSSACGKNKTAAEADGKHTPERTQAYTANAVKSSACETTKPSAEKARKNGQDKQEVDLKAKFGAPKDTWECNTCLIRNKDDLDKCEACQTSKPGTSSNDDLRLKFAAPAGSWECPTCMLQNQAADCKCVACETSKPGAQTGGSSQSGFSFNKTSTTKSGFTFGAGDSTVSSGFTFGSDSTNQNSSESSKPIFSFGSNTASTSIPDSSVSLSKTINEAKPASGFIFGGNSNEKPSTVPAFTFGASSTQEENKPSPFSFGAGNVGKTSNENESLNEAQKSEETSEKPSNTTTMNIAQAAAAGLLEVPGKDTTPSTTQTSISEPSTTKPFTFGASTVPSGGPGDEEAASTITSGTGLPTLTPSSTQCQPFPFQVSTSSTASNKTIGSLFKIEAQRSTASTVLVAPSSSGKTNQAPSFLFTPSNAAVSSSAATNSSSFSFTGSNSTAVSLPSVVTTFTNTASGKPFSFSGAFASTSLPCATTTSATSVSSTSLFNFTASNSSAPTTAPPPTTNQTSLFNFTGSSSTNSSASVSSAQGNPASLFTFTGSTSVTADKSGAAPVFNFGAVNGPMSNNGPSTTTGQTPSTAASLFSFSAAQVSSGPVFESQNSMGGEEMDADSNNNHDQAAFPQAGGFNFTAPTTGNASGLFPAGTSGTPGGNTGSFPFSGGGMTSSFSFGNTSTPSGGFDFGAAQTAGPSPFMFGVASTPANGPTNTSNAAGLFNFAGSTTNPALKPQLIVGQNSDQPALFNMGASQTPPSNRVIKKAVRRSRPK